MFSSRVLKFHSGIVRTLNSSIKRTKDSLLDIVGGFFEVRKVTLPFFKDPSQILELCCDNFSCISNMKRSISALLNNGHKVMVLHPEIFKLKPASFRDRGGYGDNTWNMVRGFHHYRIYKSGRIG